MDTALQIEVEALHARYVHAIDDDKLEAWPDLFTDPCKYQITWVQNYERGLPVGLVIATSRGMLQDRVSALRDANIYEPHRYRHLVSSVLVTGGSGGTVTAQANFQVIRIMHDGTTDLFCTGKYLDKITRTGAELRYAERLVLLDSRRIDTALAIPL